MPAYKNQKTGEWYCIFRVTDWTGKRKQIKKSCFARRADALAYEREYLAKSSRTTKMKFGSLVELYMADAKTRLRPTTYEMKQWIFETKILPYFKDQLVDEISVSSIRAWQNHLIDLFKAVKPKKEAFRNPYAHKKAPMTRSVSAVHTELNIIGKTVDEAIPEVDRFLNECFMAGVSPVRIIHGKGTGSLRRGVQDYLRTLNFVTEFHEADPSNGGAGGTEVYF